MAQEDVAAAAGIAHVLTDATSPVLKPFMSPSSALLSMLLFEDEGDNFSDGFLLDSSATAANSNQSILNNCVASQPLQRMTTAQVASVPSAAENDSAPSTLLQSSFVVNIALKPAKVALKRKHPKDELDALREELEDLQYELHDLKASGALASDQNGIERGDNGLKKAKISRLGSPATKLVLAENRNLRRLVNKQMQFTKEFEEKLCPSFEEVPSSFAFIRDSNPVSARITDADLMCYYEALVGKLDSLYTQLGDVFATCRATTDERRREAKHTFFVPCDTNAMALHLHYHKIMPFDFQSVCDVIWQCFRNEAVSGSEPGDDVVLPTEDNLVFTKKTIAMESSSDQGRREIKLSIRVITKRFVSKDRMVLCSEGKTTWPRGVIEGTDGLQMREKSWIVVKPMPSSGSMRMCVTQQCTHMSPSDGAGAVLAFPEQMNKVKMSVIPKYQQIIGGYYQCIENSLLDKQVVTTRLVL